MDNWNFRLILMKMDTQKNSTMNNDLIKSAREVIGEYLKNLREEKGISKYAIIKETGLRIELINSVETGSSAYTIDTLLKYTTGIGAYVFFGDKAGKNPDKPLDVDDMMKEIKKNDPRKT